MLPMPAALQMQLLQQQMMGGGMGSYDGFDDDMYDMIDPRFLYWMDGYGQGNFQGQINGHFNGVEQAAQYYQMLQQAQMMQQMMGYQGRGMSCRGLRKRDRRGTRMLNGGMGVGMRGMVGGSIGGYAGFGGGSRAMMGSPFGMDLMRGNQLALMGSPWGGG